MPVKIRSEERSPLRLVPPAESSAPRQPLLPPTEVMAVLGAIAMVVAARVILLLSVMGAFVLALLTVQSPSVGSIVMTALYAVFVVGPLAYLALKRG